MVVGVGVCVGVCVVVGVGEFPHFYTDGWPICISRTSCMCWTEDI